MSSQQTFLAVQGLDTLRQDDNPNTSKTLGTHIRIGPFLLLYSAETNGNVLLSTCFSNVCTHIYANSDANRNLGAEAYEGRTFRSFHMDPPPPKCYHTTQARAPLGGADLSPHPSAGRSSRCCSPRRRALPAGLRVIRRKRAPQARAQPEVHKQNYKRYIHII